MCRTKIYSVSNIFGANLGRYAEDLAWSPLKIPSTELSLGAKDRNAWRSQFELLPSQPQKEIHRTNSLFSPKMMMITFRGLSNDFSKLTTQAQFSGYIRKISNNCIFNTCEFNSQFLRILVPIVQPLYCKFNKGSFCHETLLRIVFTRLALLT